MDVSMAFARIRFTTYNIILQHGLLYPPKIHKYLSNIRLSRRLFVFLQGLSCAGNAAHGTPAAFGTEVIAAQRFCAKIEYCLSMNVLELSEQEIGRRQSLQELRDMGIDPYPAAEYPTNAFSTDIKAEFTDDEQRREVCIAGRMMSRRIMGKAAFAELQDSKGRIQVYITRDDICPDENKDLYNKVFKKLLDIGDFIGVKGFVFRTQTGEISVHAQSLTLLSKSLKPLPIVKYKDGVAYDKFDDPELRYRQRYVDLVVNDGVKDTFMQRATVIRTIRRVLDDAGYTEVETPTLQTIAGGASARPFITHFNALDTDMYMRIATELYLKRLIVGGFEGVYEIGKNFRNEGMDRNHNPEFTCMELYVQYKDYNWMMSFTEKLLETVCIAVNGKPEREIDGNIVSFKAPYRRLPILDAIKEKTGLSVTSLSGKEEAYAAWYANENYKVLKKAVLFDIGGTSTEICDFAHPYESDMISLDFGTSTIRSAFVKDVYPTKAEEEEIKAFVKGVLKEQVEKHELENAVLSGSNMNALYKIYQDYYDVPQSHERLMQYKKLKKLIKVLMNDKKRNSLIIKNVPEKTHLIVPSAICLKVMLKYFNIGNITVSSYGVKEGYLKLIKKGAVKAEPLTVAKRG